jgi:1,4-dihydroxy-2-naphthoate octaprenyltransferase
VSGKRTLAVRLGDGTTRTLYAALLLSAFMSLPGIALRRPWVFLAFMAAPFAARPLRRIASGVSGPALVPVLVDTSRLQLVYGGLLAFGLAVST